MCGMCASAMIETNKPQCAKTDNNTIGLRGTGSQETNICRSSSTWPFNPSPGTIGNANPIIVSNSIPLAPLCLKLHASGP
jgi:hypothetical protein